jgi:hypothetical protein
MGRDKKTSAIKANKAKPADVAKADNKQTGAKPKNPLPKQKQPRPGIERDGWADRKGRTQGPAYPG